MAILNSFLFKRTMLKFLECKDLDSKKGKALTDKIKSSASDNLDSILETIATADSTHSEYLKSVCLEDIDSISGDFFLDNLSHDKTAFRSAASDILVQSKVVTPDKLFRQLFEPGAIRSEIVKVLHSQKQTLKPEDVINNALKLESTDGLQLLGLIEGSSAPLDLSKIGVQPKKIKNLAFSIKLLRYLSHVQQPEVATLIIQFLSGTNKGVALEALKSLSKLSVRFDVSPILPLIDNMSNTEHELVLEIITNQINPILIPQLSYCFSGKPSPIHTALAIIIAEHTNKNSFEGFLIRLEKEEIWARDQTINTFLKLHNKNLFGVARELNVHESDFVRSSAQKIAGYQLDSVDLEKIGEFAISDDWPVRLRAIQSLGKSSNRASVAVLKNVLEKCPDAAVAVLEAVKQLGFSKGLEIAFLCLDKTETAVQRAALETIGSIATKEHLKSVRDSITWKIPAFSPEIIALANLTLEKLDPNSTDITKMVDSNKKASLQFNKNAYPSSATSLDSIKIGSLWMERFHILKEIGRGAMGVVMLVEDEVVNESLVLKVMHPELTMDQDSRERFKREFAYTRKVSHPSVIRVHELFLKNNICAISMEYFESKGLNIILKKQKTFDSREGLELLLQLCSGFAAAHKQGVIHRDIKPSNILINSWGEVKIVDFGIAAATNSLDATLTRTGAIIGSPAYLSPERADGQKAENRSDIYSLGIIAYYMFSGQLPYKGKPMEVLMQHREGNAAMVHEVNKSASPEIAELVKHMMAVEPDNRPKSMLAVLDQIKTLIASP